VRWGGLSDTRSMSMTGMKILAVDARDDRSCMYIPY